MDKTNLPLIRPTGGPLPHDNPAHDFYEPEFKRIFRDLLTVRYAPGDAEHGLINGTMDFVFKALRDPKDRAQWEQIVRAAYRYLREDAHKGLRETCEAYVRIIDLIPDALNACVEGWTAAESQSAGDGRARAYLSLYKTICERLLTVIAAPVAVGFRHVYGLKDNRYTPKPDGRVNLSVLDDMENWIQAPSNLLKEGLDRHVRNAFAHERYKLLDNSRVELSDVDPKTGKVNWTEVWSHAQVEALCRRLWLTCVAIETALAMFGSNYSQLIRDRGWEPQDRLRAEPRFETTYDLMGHIASEMSMVRTNLSLEDKILRVELTTLPGGTNHVERKTIGDQGPVPIYEKRVRYLPAPIAVIAVEFLRAAAEYVPDADIFVASIKGHDGKPVGELQMDRAAFASPSEPTIEGISNVRALAKVDTLGDATMWVAQPLPMTPVRPT